MNPETNSQTVLFEKRWPVGLTIIVVALLLWSIPDRISLIPSWIAYFACSVMLIPITAIGFSKAKPLWLKIEKYTLGFFLTFTAIGNSLNLINLVEDMLFKSSEINGIQLLSSSVAVWIINVLLFSLLYWQIDRGGPEERQISKDQKADWLFSEESAPDNFAPKNWSPVFVDYLYLGYSTSTAFSTTDTMPLSKKAKLLMMLQSFISLVIIVVVGARAINIIGS